MSVSDLTNTKWVLNSTISEYLTEANQYSINFTSNGTNFTSIGGEDEISHEIDYDNTRVYRRGTWNNQSYRIISITGGTDATNATLISWLEANATQVPVVDLSGTEWEIKKPSDMVYTPGFTSLTSLYLNGVCDFLFPTINDSIDINFTFDGISLQSNLNNSLPVTVINILHNINPPAFPALRGTMNYDSYDGLIYFASQGGGGEYPGDIPFNLSITSGTDTTNPDLIAWLSQNATYQVPIVANTYTLTHTLTNLTKGNMTFTIVADSGYTLPSSSNDFTIANGSIVSYDNQTGVLVVSGSDSTTISCECPVAPSGYSGNISTYNVGGGGSTRYTKIKFDTPPSSDNDYDAYVNTNGVLAGATTYTNQTKVYVWGNGGVVINEIIDLYVAYYSAPVEIILTGDYTISLIYNVGGGGA